MNIELLGKDVLSQLTFYALSELSSEKQEDMWNKFKLSVNHGNVDLVITTKVNGVDIDVTKALQDQLALMFDDIEMRIREEAKALLEDKASDIVRSMNTLNEQIDNITKQLFGGNSEL
jgi:uncharacterized lipoprotein YehR (DUF1307 family)